jgi:hypothetical protein
VRCEHDCAIIYFVAITRNIPFSAVVRARVSSDHQVESWYYATLCRNDDQGIPISPGARKQIDILIRGIIEDINDGKYQKIFWAATLKHISEKIDTSEQLLDSDIQFLMTTEDSRCIEILERLPEDDQIKSRLEYLRELRKFENR